MTNTQHTSMPIPQTKNKRILLLILIPLTTCIISSVVGIVLGQMGNLIYPVIGQAASCLVIPGFCGLFLVTFGISFLGDKLLRKWLISKGK